ncbi:MAG: 1-(5-phosphoribosyl)-5-[(5-phosphoribosylamino)methylideneamino]imidazole-4-carboxamide isomerase [Candidatus Dormibacteraeota bacterium]|nr:1-(5-phosphoribosyl)-5-[(5-phosphoribosylamino)methylideneamino]imidazole-4-carboxamide isomerase [Candidatus Dormibacteraeota bacterium]
MSALLVIPAVDILGGQCVRLVKGDFHHPTVYSDDPLDVVAEFARAGAKRVHVVDLDAARGSGDNQKLIEPILQRSDIQVQVAGGVRTAEAVEVWMRAGAQAVVMGTAAVRDPRLLDRCARRHPGRVLAALDVRDDKAAVSGWTETEPVMMGSVLGRWDGLPLGGVILTCIDRDGTLSGPDLKTLARARSMTGLKLYYSGGISSLEDIKLVATAGAEAVILGKALYEGRFTLEQALAT